ncbi:MAG: hypothetical protein AABX11_05375 [Nanoarchaeota archaeon]
MDPNEVNDAIKFAYNASSSVHTAYSLMAMLDSSILPLETRQNIARGSGETTLTGLSQLMELASTKYSSFPVSRIIESDITQAQARLRAQITFLLPPSSS